MTIRVPFQLRRRASSEPAVALLVPARDPVELFAICGRLGLDPSRSIFDVAGGFLLQLERPATGPMPGAIRLRELTKAFYVPADAELIPGLLDDEAAGMVRDWGVVFLPGGRTLLFDRHAPVEIRELLRAEPRPRREWSPLPEPEQLADQVDQIMLDLPQQSPEALYRELKQEFQRPSSRAKRSKRQDEDRSDGGDATTCDCPPDTDGAAVPHAGRPGQAGAPGETVAGSAGSTLPDLRKFVNNFRDLAARARRALASRKERAGSNRDPGPGDGSKDGASRGGPSPSSRNIGHFVEGMSRRLSQMMASLKEKAQWERVDHSALVRKLVREFREGDPARALRRAIPITRPDGPTIPVRALWLPWSQAIYNLLELLRRPGRGEAIPVRLAQDNVLRELAAEYRKAAEQAVKQGDFRRAAYIYGVLLGDDRMAATVLQRAGLHHDAAILYSKKLNDPAAAAQAFEAAGLVDRALALYRQLGQHELAGDLLRRIGDLEAAVAEYQLAAKLLVAFPLENHLGAGCLLLEKARRPDLAIEHFQTGWGRRPAESAALCALELARLHAQRGAIEPIRSLLDQADEFFESVGSDREAAGFYNGVVAIFDTRVEPPLAEEVRDRALLSLARRMRQGVEGCRASASLVSTLLGRTKLWPAPVVSDADFAATAALKQRPRDQASAVNRDPEAQGIQIGRGILTAAVQASITGELFLGFDSGLVLGFRPERNQVVKVADDIDPVTALAVDPEGQTVVALRRSHRGTLITRSLKRPDGSFRSRPESHLPVPDGGVQRYPSSPILGPRDDAESRALPDTWLTPIVSWGVERLVGIVDGHGLLIVDAASGLHWGRLAIEPDSCNCPTTALLLATSSRNGATESRLVVLTHAGPRWIVVDVKGKLLHQTTSQRWLPAAGGSSSVRSAPIAWRHVPPFLELVGLDQNGAAYAAQFYVDDGSLELLAEWVASTEGGYLAAARAGPNTVVAISWTGIDWLGHGADRFHLVHKLKLGFPTAVACFTSPTTQETLVVCSDGFVARVAAPRRVVTTSSGG